MVRVGPQSFAGPSSGGIGRPVLSYCTVHGNHPAYLDGSSTRDLLLFSRQKSCSSVSRIHRIHKLIEISLGTNREDGLSPTISQVHQHNTHSIVQMDPLQVMQIGHGAMHLSLHSLASRFSLLCLPTLPESPVPSPHAGWSNEHRGCKETERAAACIECERRPPARLHEPRGRAKAVDG